MNRAKHIAIVEDDDTIRELLADNLKKAGYRVAPFFTAEQFERKSDGGYNLLLLDIMLPGKNGLQLLKELRDKGETLPVILVTASDAESHIDTALGAGAIDYIVKPFNLKHLLLKIENLLNQMDAAHFDERGDTITIGMGKYDRKLHTVLREKVEHKLTPSEAATLNYFIEHPNRIISREELQEKTTTDAKGLSSRNLDNYILKFRKLFEIDAKDPVIFVTIPRKGYALKR